jgi:hypothetical protein
MSEPKTDKVTDDGHQHPLTPQLAAEGSGSRYERVWRTGKHNSGPPHSTPPGAAEGLWCASLRLKWKTIGWRHEQE